MKKISIYLALSLAMAFSAFTACGEDVTDTGDAGKDNSSVHEHVDGNNDGVCDGCKDDGGHEHTYENVWTAAETNHYKAATCGHDVKLEEPHTKPDPIGQCTVCGYQLETVSAPETVEGAVELGVYQHKVITSGTYTSESTSEYGDDYSVSWQYGDNYTHVVYANQYTNWEGWYSMLSNVLFAIEKEDGEVSRKTEEQAYCNMNGYGFGGDFAGYFLDSYKAYGVEGLLEYLYEEASTDWNLDFEESVETLEDKKEYSFSYGVITESGYFYTVEVSFTLGDDFEINSAEIQSNGYDGTQYTVDEDYIATIKTSATASYVYNVTIEQSTEEPEEAFVNPYNAKKLLASSFEFDVKDNSNKPVTDVTFGEKMTLTAKQNYKFYFKNVLPETADMTYTTVEFLIDGETLQGINDQRVWCVFASDHSNFYINPQKAGEYNFAVIINDVEYPIALTVLPPHPTKLTPYVCIDENADAWESNKTATAYEGVALKFKAMGDTEEYNASYTAKVTSGEATLTVDENGVTSFTASTAGQYVVTLTSSVVSKLSTTLTITVQELPDMTDRLNGTYKVELNNTLMYEMVFTPESDGAVKGTLSLIEKQQDKGTQVYSYSFEGGKLVMEHVDGPEFTNITVMLDGRLNVIALNVSGGVYSVSKVGAVAEVPDISGTYNLKYMNVVMYVMTIDESTISFEEKQQNKGTAVYNYTIADGAISTEYVSGPDTFGLTVSLDADGNVKVMMNSSGNYLTIQKV